MSSSSIARKFSIQRLPARAAGPRIVRFSLLIMLGFVAQVPSGVAGERYALLVGVRSYSKTELTSLRYSEDDVTALRDVLVERGYPKENVVLMTQKIGAEETRYLPLAENIRKEIDLLLRECGKEDHLLLSFAGHGVQFDGEDEIYFCPADAKLKDRSKLLPLNEILQRLKDSPAATKVLLVDACRNDPLATVRRGEIELKPVGARQPIAPPQGIAALFSCRATEAAFEHPKLQHGVFFHYVIEAFKGEGDLDKDGGISLAELELYTVKRVQKYARTELGEAQTPERRGSTSGEIMLASVPRAAPVPMPTPSSTPTKSPEPAVAVVGNAPAIRPSRVLPQGGHSIAVLADGRILTQVPGNREYCMALWNPETGKEIRRFPRVADWINMIVVSPDGRLAVSGGWDGTIRLWNVETGELIRDIEEEYSTGEKVYVALTPDNQYIISGKHSDRTIHLHEVETGKLVGPFANLPWVTTEYLRDLVLTPDGKRVICTGQSYLSVFDVQERKRKKRISTGSSCIAVSHDGNFALIGAAVGSVMQMFDVSPQRDFNSSLKPLASFPGNGLTSCVAFSPDSRRALSGETVAYNEDERPCVARLWDVQGVKEICRLEGHTSSLKDLKFSPDGTKAITAGYDAIRIWNLPE